MSTATNGRRPGDAPVTTGETPKPQPVASAGPPASFARPPMPPSRRMDDDDDVVELTSAQIDELKRALEARRTQIFATLEARREQDREAGHEVGDEMDEANTEGVTAMASKLLERDVQLLREIERALAKIVEGTYGACEGTGEPIGYARLKLRPWARYSIAHQEEIERAAKSRGGV